MFWSRPLALGQLFADQAPALKTRHWTNVEPVRAVVRHDGRVVVARIGTSDGFARVGPVHRHLRADDVHVVVVAEEGDVAVDELLVVLEVRECRGFAWIQVAPPSVEDEYQVSRPMPAVEAAARPRKTFPYGMVRKSPTVPGGPVALSFRPPVECPPPTRIGSPYPRRRRYSAACSTRTIGAAVDVIKRSTRSLPEAARREPPVRRCGDWFRFAGFQRRGSDSNPRMTFVIDGFRDRLEMTDLQDFSFQFASGVAIGMDTRVVASVSRHDVRGGPELTHRAWRHQPGVARGTASKSRSSGAPRSAKLTRRRHYFQRAPR